MTNAAPGRALGSLFQQLAAFALSRAVLLGVTVAAAQAAGVEEYGSFALALVVFQAGLLLRDAGLGHALIVLRRDSGDLTWAVFLGTTAIGVALATFMATFSRPIASYAGLPEADEPLRILALAFGIGSLGVASNASLEQQLRFRARAVIDVAAFAALGVVSLGLLAAGAGAEALAWGHVAHAVTQTATAVALVRPWRHRSIALAGVGKLFRYGGLLWAGAFLAYISANADNAIVGRIGGAAALGAYALSYTLGNTVTISLAQVVNRVALPYYARASGDPSGIAEAIRAVVPLATAAAMVPAVGIIALAPEIRATVIGDEYSSIPIVALAVYGVVRGLGMSLGTVLNATRRARTATWYSGVNAVTMLALIVPAHALWGISGVAVAVLAAMAGSTAFMAGSVAEVRASGRFLAATLLVLLGLAAAVVVPDQPLPVALRGVVGLGLACAFAWRAMNLLRGAFWQRAGVGQAAA